MEQQNLNDSTSVDNMTCWIFLVHCWDLWLRQQILSKYYCSLHHLVAVPWNCTFPPDFIFVEAPANVCFSSSPAILGYRPLPARPSHLVSCRLQSLWASVSAPTLCHNPPASVLSHPFLFTWRAPACLLKFSFSHTTHEEKIVWHHRQHELLLKLKWIWVSDLPPPSPGGLGSLSLSFLIFENGSDVFS